MLTNIVRVGNFLCGTYRYAGKLRQQIIEFYPGATNISFVTIELCDHRLVAINQRYSNSRGASLFDGSMTRYHWSEKFI